MPSSLIEHNSFDSALLVDHSGALTALLDEIPETPVY